MQDMAESHVLEACRSLADQFGICRASDAKLSDQCGVPVRTLARVLSRLEFAGRIDRETYYLKLNARRRLIRTFPGHYFVSPRHLMWCEDRSQFLYLHEAVGGVAPTSGRRPPQVSLTPYPNDPFEEVPNDA